MLKCMKFIGRSVSASAPKHSLAGGWCVELLQSGVLHNAEILRDMLELGVDQASN